MRWQDISFSNTTLRQFAALWIVFFAALAMWYGLRHGQHTLGYTLGILAFTIGPLGLLWPGFIKPIYTTWMVAVFPVGWLVSNVMLGIVFFLLITPVAIFFKLIGRDPLQRRARREAESYWQTKELPDNIGRYLRQY